jgi:hypothetical protein
MLTENLAMPEFCVNEDVMLRLDMVELVESTE